jgi:hypothetical protein
MWTYKKAELLAKTWVELVSDSNLALFTELTITKPYGWIFFYGSKDPDELIGGNAPIIFDRINGEIIVTGTAHPIEKYIADYEAKIPKARFQMRPEYPKA